MSNFRPMGVDPAGWNFGLDKLNRELDRHQFIRELTQNGVEAIQQTPLGEGVVNWELYHLEIDGQDVHKLCCIDNGVGMTGEELVDYINTGFKSGKQRGHQANFGIGAKVSALTFNKAGVLYMSWKDGKGSMIHLAQDQRTGFYGLNQLSRPDGTFGWWAPIGDERKPKSIEDHGTVVVLMGDDPLQETFERPEGSELPQTHWVAAYLQRKYLRFPEGIAIKARYQGEYRIDRSGQTKRNLATISGQMQLLAAHTQECGIVKLEGAQAHWWLLKEPPKKRTGNVLQQPTGHVAALYKDELYEARYGTRGGYQRLGSCGVAVGQGRVVVYFEPDAECTETNLTRQQLLVDGERFPWDKYAAAFSENLPEPIKVMMNNLIERADARSNKAKIAERLKELKQLLDSAHRYRVTEDGDVSADTPTIGGDPQELGRSKETEKDGGGLGGLRAHIDRLIQTAQGEKAKRKNTQHQTPDVIWVSVSDGTRERGYLEEKAAVYDPLHNRITGNKDFRNFKRVLKAIKNAVPHSNGAGEAATMLEFETVLVESVMNLKAMEGSAEWTAEDVKQQFSPEAMTNCVNHTFHILKAAREEVRRQMKAANEKP